MPFDEPKGEAVAVIELKGGDTALGICFLARTYPEAHDSWNYNFVNVRVEASAPGFRARFDESLSLGELLRFREDLTRLYRDLKGEVKMSVMDHFVELTAHVGLKGDIGWDILLQHPGGTGARLRATLWNDQSYLPTLLRQIDDVFAAYPLWQG